MSETGTTSSFELFEVLPGLPGIGPIPESFSATGQGSYREGFVVRFCPRTSESWVGNFQGGHGSLNGVFPHPDGHTVIVVFSGQAYQVNPCNRALLHHFGGCLAATVQDDSRRLLIFADSTRLWAFDMTGLRWVSERVSIDGIRNLRIEADSVGGEHLDPCNDKWHPFSVSLENGKLKKLFIKFFRQW